MKILLVEDALSVESALTQLLLQHHYVVNLAVDEKTALALAKTFDYDLIVLNLIMAIDEVELCQQFRDQLCTPPILLLTDTTDSHQHALALDAGADDCMVRPYDAEELMALIRAILRRSKAVLSPIVSWETIRFDPIQGEVTSNGRSIHLTPKEFCLLELFLYNPKRMFSRRDILDRLWDFAEAPSEETVSTHIKGLRQRLKAAGVADPIETVHGVGYRLRQPRSFQPAPESP